MQQWWNDSQTGKVLNLPSATVSSMNLTDGLAWDRIRVSGARGRRVTVWTTAQTAIDQNEYITRTEIFGSYLIENVVGLHDMAVSWWCRGVQWLGLVAGTAGNTWAQSVGEMCSFTFKPGFQLYGIYRSVNNEWERVWKEMGLTRFDVVAPCAWCNWGKLKDTAVITSGLPKRGKRLRTLPVRNRTPVLGL